MGFSTRTCLPARSAATVTSSCRKVGRQRSTASISGSARTPARSRYSLIAGEIETLARAVRDCPGWRSGRRLAAAHRWRIRPARVAPGTSRRARRCTPPMKSQSKHRDTHRFTILPRGREALLENALFRRVEAESQVEIDAPGAFAVIRLDGRRNAVTSTFAPIPVSTSRNGRDVARVSHGVGLYAERASGGARQSFFDLRLEGEQFVLIHQFQTGGQKVAACRRVERLRAGRNSDCGGSPSDDCAPRSDWWTTMYRDPADASIVGTPWCAPRRPPPGVPDA